MMWRACTGFPSTSSAADAPVTDELGLRNISRNNAEGYPEVLRTQGYTESGAHFSDQHFPSALQGEGRRFEALSAHRSTCTLSNRLTERVGATGMRDGVFRPTLRVAEGPGNDSRPCTYPRHGCRLLWMR